MPITLLTIDEIDARREAAGIKIGKLCRRADIDSETYRRRMADKTGGMLSAMINLNTALLALEKEAGND